MDLSTNLTHDLAALAAFLPPVPASGAEPADHDELTRSLASLRDAAALAVSSLLGLSMTVTVHGQDVTLTSMTPASETAQKTARSVVTASLRVPLSVLSVPADGVVVFYASTPGAFVDLAADLTYELGLDQDRLVLDEETVSMPVSGITGTRRLSLVNMAIGVLIDRGHTVADAEEALQRRAAESQVELYEAADQIVSGVTGSPSAGRAHPAA